MMEWGWEQWVVAVVFAHHSYAIVSNIKKLKDYDSRYGVVAFNIVCGIEVAGIVALVSGGFF